MEQPTILPPLDSEGFGEEECDMLFDVDLNGTITMVRFLNRKLAEKLGYGERELIGQNVTDFMVDSKTVAGMEHFGKLYASETAFRATSRKIKLKNGEVLGAESYLMPMYDSSGTMIGNRGMEFFKEELQ